MQDTSTASSAWSWIRPRTDHHRHLFAFYSYAWACEVFSLVSAAVFIPMLLEQLARTHGLYGPEHVIACTDTANHTSQENSRSCDVALLGYWVDTASFSLSVKSISVAVQAVSVISISVLADVLEYRKRLLLSFAWIGSLATALYLFLPTARQGSVYLAAVFSIIAVACFGDSFVCLNAYLGQLVRDDPEVMASAALVTRPGGKRPGPVEPLVDSYDDQENVSLLAAAAEALDPDSSTNKHMLEEQSRLTEEAHIATVSLVTTRTSSMGIAIGYAAGVAMLCLSVIPVAQSQGSLESLSTVIGVTGLWWAIFTFPAATWLPTRRNRISDISAERHEQISANPQLSEHATSPVNVKSKVAEGWKRVAQVFNKQELRRLSQLYWFLFSWALLADAFNTTTSVAILFAKTTLRMSAPKTIAVGVLTQFTAIFSAVMTPLVQAKLGISAKSLLVASVLGVAGMCVWGLTALNGESEMYCAAVWFGLMFGPFNTLSRSVFSELVPPGHDARFFSLFSITDKGASWLGPAAIAVIAGRTGDIRQGFWFLLVLLVLPLPILLRRVDIKEGKRQGGLYGGDENEISL